MLSEIFRIFFAQYRFSRNSSEQSVFWVNIFFREGEKLHAMELNFNPSNSFMEIHWNLCSRANADFQVIATIEIFKLFIFQNRGQL